MKKFIFILFFILFSGMGISFSQIYQPFPDTLASWNQIAYSSGDPAFPFFNQGWRINLSTDSIINGVYYTLVGFDSTYYHSYWAGGNDILIENYSYNLPGEIFGALREDSNRKVWFRRFHDIDLGLCFSFNTNIFPLDSDLLIYDYDINAGDTITWKPFNNVVMQTDSIQLLNGEWRRKILFNSGSEFWIEGIGSNLGFFGAYQMPPEEYSCMLSCFRLNDTLLFPTWTFNYECDFVYTGTEKSKSEITIVVFPNPAVEFVQFNIPGLNGRAPSIKIYNANGKQVVQYPRMKSASFKIPGSELGGNGLYYYIINVDNRKNYSGKFLYFND